MLIHTINMIHISPSFEELVGNTIYPGVIRNPPPGDPAVIYQNKAFLKVVFFFSPQGAPALSEILPEQATLRPPGFWNILLPYIPYWKKQIPN